LEASKPTFWGSESSLFWPATTSATHDPETAREEGWTPSTFVSEILFLVVLLVLASLENILDG